MEIVARKVDNGRQEKGDILILLKPFKRLHF